MIFAVLAGSRRIVFGDSTGRAIHARARVFFCLKACASQLELLNRIRGCSSAFVAGCTDAPGFERYQGDRRPG